MFQFALEATLLELKQDTPQIAPLLELPPRNGRTLNPQNLELKNCIIFLHLGEYSPKPPKEVYKKEPRQRSRPQQKPHRRNRNKTPRKAPHRRNGHHETGRQQYHY